MNIIYATLHLRCQQNHGVWCDHWLVIPVSALTLLGTLSVAAGRWSERVDHQIVVEEKEVHREHEYGSATIPVHGESGTGAAWRHCVGSFCGNRQVEIRCTLIVYFRDSHNMILVTSVVEPGLLSS